jgi:prephenate dehydrogenase
MPFKVLVVGGAGGMGRWCARLFKRSGFDVYISSRKDASEAARSMGVHLSGMDFADAYDIIVLSVPIDAVAEVASKIAPRMKRGSLLMDLSSLKKKPVEAMLKFAPPGAEVIGVHPLFGPESGGRGRTIVMVPASGSERWAPVIKDLFSDEGFNVVVSTAEEHDMNMAVVQGLTHFMYISMALALERASVDVGMTSAFKTPVYGITMELVGRVLSQSPELYALIQSSEEARALRRAFVEASRELALKLDTGDIPAFIRDFESAARYYGDTAGAKKRSERIIQMEMEDRLSIMDAIGKERAFVLDGKAVYGVIRQAGPDTFTLETLNGMLTLKYEDVSRISGKALETLKSGVEPLIRRDIMVKMPIGADPDVLKWVLTKIEDVRCVDVETIDALGPDNVLCHFTISVPAEESEKSLQQVLKTIWSLGLEVK